MMMIDNSEMSMELLSQCEIISQHCSSLIYYLDISIFGFLTWKVVTLENTVFELSVTYSTTGTAVLLLLCELKYGIC